MQEPGEAEMIRDFYWTIEGDLLNPGLKYVTYRNADTGEVLGKWVTNKELGQVNEEIMANRQALLNSFNAVVK